MKTPFQHALWRLAAIVLVVVAVAFLLGSPMRWLDTTRTLLAIARLADAEATLAPRAPPVIAWTIEGRAGEADLYTPTGRPRAALVLAPGAAVAGRDEPRLQALAATFAAAGFVVAVPEVPGLRRLALSADDAVALADAARELGRRHPDLPLGLLAISYGVGPAVIAALEPDLRERIGFVVGIGGYRDSTAVIQFVTTGTYRRLGDGRLHRTTPNPYGRWAFLRANAHRLEDPLDATLLRLLAARLARGDRVDNADLRGLLTPDGAAVLDLMENDKPELVPALLGALPAAIRRDIEGLNLSLHELGSLKALLILIHGRDDATIPWGESEALAAAVPAGQARVFLVEGMGHVGFRAGSLATAWTMWRALDEILAQRRR